MRIQDYNFDTFRMVVSSNENLVMFTVSIFLLTFFLVMLVIVQFIVSFVRRAEISEEHNHVVKEREAVAYSDSIIRDVLTEPPLDQKSGINLNMNMR